MSNSKNSRSKRKEDSSAGEHASDVMQQGEEFGQQREASSSMSHQDKILEVMQNLLLNQSKMLEDQKKAQDQIWARAQEQEQERLRIQQEEKEEEAKRWQQQQDRIKQEKEQQMRQAQKELELRKEALHINQGRRDEESPGGDYRNAGPNKGTGGAAEVTATCREDGAMA